MLAGKSEGKNHLVDEGIDGKIKKMGRGAEHGLDGSC